MTPKSGDDQDQQQDPETQTSPAESLSGPRDEEPSGLDRDGDDASPDEHKDAVEDDVFEEADPYESEDTAEPPYNDTGEIDDGVYEEDVYEEEVEEPQPVETKPSVPLREATSFIVPERDKVSAPKSKRVFKPLHLFAWLFAHGAIFGTVAVAVVAIFLIQISNSLPSAQAMKNYEPKITTRIHAGDGSLVAEFARERRLFVPIDSIPDRVIEAFVAAEDQNFYAHEGVDPQGIVRAAIANIDNIRNDRRLEGASTITQQVARNFLLTSEVSYERKLKEALIAMRMERIFTKDEILELYLNEIYLGGRSYGVAAAALSYFDKSLEELTLGEIAYLAVLPKAPNNYQLPRYLERALDRRNYVIGRMLEDGYITQAEAVAARSEDLVTKERPDGAQMVEAEYFAEEVRRELFELYDVEGLYDGGLSVRTSLDPELQKLARTSLRAGLAEYDRRHGWRGPHAVIENFDPGNWVDGLAATEAPRNIDPWRPAAVLSVSDSAAQIGFLDGETGEVPFSEMSWARPWLKGERVGAAPSSAKDVVSAGDVIFVEPLNASSDETGATVGFENKFGLRQIPAVNGAIIAMDPHTGRVLAMEGGFSFESSEFNRATQALRQPGSSFKPIVYSAALDNGYTPSSIMLDGPLVVDQGPGLPLWKPKNYSAKYYGESTLRVGMEQSRNLMTARLALDMGMGPIVEYANKLGVKDDLQPTPAMALGAGETTLLRMIGAYAVMVNGGKDVEPTLIDQIQNRYGKAIYKHDPRECEGCSPDEWAFQEEPLLTDNREQLLDPRTAYQIVSIMEGAILRGTGRKLRSLGKPIGGKTGTTNEARDAWFIGFTPDFVVGSYVGFDTPRSLGPRETGGGVALPVVKRFLEGALADKPGVPFRVPPGIKLVRVNLKTGRLAGGGDTNVILEAFKPGTEPSGRNVQSRNTIGSDGLPVDFSGGSNGPLSSGTGGLY